MDSVYRLFRLGKLATRIGFAKLEPPNEFECANLAIPEMSVAEGNWNALDFEIEESLAKDRLDQAPPHPPIGQSHPKGETVRLHDRFESSSNGAIRLTKFHGLDAWESLAAKECELVDKPSLGPDRGLSIRKSPFSLFDPKWPSNCGLVR